MTYTTKTWNPVETDTQTSASSMAEEPWADSVTDKVHEDPSLGPQCPLKNPSAKARPIRTVTVGSLEDLWILLAS